MKGRYKFLLAVAISIILSLSVMIFQNWNNYSDDIKENILISVAMFQAISTIIALVSLEDAKWLDSKPWFKWLSIPAWIFWILHKFWNWIA